VIQRCQVHKRRNIEAYLPDKHHDELRERLNAAYHETNATQARALLTATVKWLRQISPAAAASLEEGLDETLTVVHLGVSGVSNRCGRAAIKNRWPCPVDAAQLLRCRMAILAVHRVSEGGELRTISAQMLTQPAIAKSPDVAALHMRCI